MIFHDANRAQTIHKYDIKPNIGKRPIGHLGQIFFCAGIQRFHLARAYTPSSAVKFAASLQQTPVHHHPARSDQFHRVCHVNSAERLENQCVRDLWKCTLLPINPRDTTSHHDYDGFLQMGSSVLFANFQRQLVNLTARFIMRLGNGINSIPHRHRLKRHSQHHV